MGEAGSCHSTDFPCGLPARKGSGLIGTEEARVHSPARIPFVPLLAVEVVIAVVARIAYTLTVGQHLELGLDSIGYTLLGAMLAGGHGYSNPSVFLTHAITRPTANFVPGYPLFLAGLLKLGITTRTGFQLAGALCGGVTVLLTGLFGKRISGRASVGLIAAGLAVVSATLIASDGSVMSEAIAVPLTVGLLTAAAWAGGSTSLPRWGLVGVLAGLLVLVRSEDLLNAVVLAPVAVLVAPAVSMRRRAIQAATVLVVAAAVLAPWVIRNYETFTPRVLLSSNDGKTLAGANCGSTYNGPLIGYWEFSCIGHDEGTEYLRSHLGRLPLVVGARVARAWGLFEPLQQARLDALQSRSIGWQQIAWPESLLLLLIAIPGMVRLRRDRFALVLVAGPVVISTLVVASTFGNPRYVVAATPSLCVGAALTVVALSDRFGARGRHRPPGGDGDTDGPADTPESAQIGGTASP
jgi:hypothetical protein